MITAVFIGYLVAGFPGALIAGIFTPIYVGAVIPGRWFVRHRDVPTLLVGLLSLVYLWRLKEPVLVLAAGVIGLAIRGLERCRGRHSPADHAVHPSSCRIKARQLCGNNA